MKTLFTTLLFSLFTLLSNHFTFAGESNQNGGPRPLLKKNVEKSKPFAPPESSEEDDDDENMNFDIPDMKQDSKNSDQPNESDEKRLQFQGEFHSWLAAGLKDKDNNAFYFNYSRIQLSLTQLYKNIIFHVKANARYNTIYDNQSSDNYRRGENIRLDLKEAYINYEAAPGTFLKQFNFIAGIQTVNWGKADEVRPTDIISPQDMTLFMLELRNERKLGRFGIKTVFGFSDAFRFESIWLPMQRNSEITTDSNSIFTPPAYFAMTVNDVTLPEKKLSNSDIALKAYLQLLGIDFSFSFYNGYDPLPYSEFSGANAYPFLSRLTMWGFDFEKAIGSIVIRGEVAYFSKGRMFSVNQITHPTLFTKHGEDGTAEKDYLDVTFGFDKNDFLVPKMYLNLQYSMNYIIDHEAGLKNRMGNKVNETNHMGIWDIYYEWDNLTYRIEFAGNYNFTHKDFLFNPSFHIKLGIETKMTLGAYIFGGDTNTNMGQYKDKTFGYLELEHLF